MFVGASKPLWDALLRFALSLARVRHDADDLVQTTLVKGLQGFPRFVESNFPGVTSAEEARRAFERPEAITFLRNWLFKILKNSFLDACAKNKRMEGEDSFSEASLDHQAMAVGWHGNATRPHQVEATYSGEEKALEKELAALEKEFYRLALDDDWKEKMEALTSRQRSVLFLAAEGYAYKEIATLLDIPIGTVMSNLSRSLAKLKKPVAL